MRDSVVADSTFYSCCACDIKRKDILFRFLSTYPFYLGDKISGDLQPHAKKCIDTADDLMLFVKKKIHRSKIFTFTLRS